jgi:hypothetical protein
MKRFLLSLAILVLGQTIVSAQIYEKNVEFDKKKYNAFVTDLNYPAAAVETALMKGFAKLGYKPKQEKGLFNKDKGYLVFSAAIVKSIYDTPSDYLVKVEDAGKKGKEASTLTFVVINQGVALSREVDQAKDKSARDFIGSFDADFIAETLELQIKSQEDAVAKTEKKLNNLKQDQLDLEKKLENNKQSQKDTEAELAAKNQALELLRGKRIVPAGN